ncbi:MAG: hypothetical protein U1F51_18365 [Burkholderiales bacterium]
MSTTGLRRLARVFVAIGCACFALAAHAAGETFQVVSVNTTGCDSAQFGMTVERGNLDGGNYTVRTVVTVDGLVYMNEDATISINGLSSWAIFNNFNYGPVPNQGTYPIPSGRPMRLDFTLERPKGTILYAWTLIVDGCDTGNIQFNGPPGRPSVSVPTVSNGTLAVLALLMFGAFAWQTTRRREG